MFNRKTANIVLILLFSLSFTFLPDNVHALGDCSSIGHLSYSYQNLKQPIPTGSCAVNCCSGFNQSSCDFEACIDLDLPDTMVATAGMRNHSFTKVRLFSRDGIADDPFYPSLEQRCFSSLKEVSTPLYIKNLTLLR